MHLPSHGCLCQAMYHAPDTISKDSMLLNPGARSAHKRKCQQGAQSLWTALYLESEQSGEDADWHSHIYSPHPPSPTSRLYNKWEEKQPSILEFSFIPRGQVCGSWCFSHLCMMPALFPCYLISLGAGRPHPAEPRIPLEHPLDQRSSQNAGGSVDRCADSVQMQILIYIENTNVYLWYGIGKCFICPFCPLFPAQGSHRNKHSWGCLLKCLLHT